MRPRIFLLNQCYWPGVEATAHLLSELCKGLAANFDVTVVIRRLHGRPELPTRAIRNGVQTIRVESTACDRFLLFAAHSTTRTCTSD